MLLIQFIFGMIFTTWSHCLFPISTCPYCRCQVAEKEGVFPTSKESNQVTYFSRKNVKLSSALPHRFKGTSMISLAFTPPKRSWTRSWRRARFAVSWRQYRSRKNEKGEWLVREDRIQDAFSRQRASIKEMAGFKLSFSNKTNGVESSSKIPSVQKDFRHHAHIH